MVLYYDKAIVYDVSFEFRDCVMLKKILLVAAVALSSTAAFADNDIGCGAGTQIWAGKEGKVSKILAATTNGSTANQLFGLTFGTLGCNGQGTIKAQVVEFVDGNSEALARDMAVGQGENLNVLAELLNIKEADQAHFYSVAKANFGTIYSAGSATADVVANLQNVLAADATLKAYV